MSAIGFYLQCILLYLISLLPFGVLYLFSDFLYFVLYYLFKYRRKVVRENINYAFPERPAEERNHIEKKFYRHFADMIVESLKMIQLSPRQLGKRIQLLNPEILNKYRDSGRSIMAVTAHYGNWEWTLGIVQHLNYKTIGVYKPLNNKRFDKFVNNIRTKFDTEFVSMREVIRTLVRYNQQKIPTFNVFVADQSPVWEEIQYWKRFLNQLTPVYLGPEKIAKQFNMVVLFGKVQKTGRGRYTVELVPLEENPKETDEFEITGKFFAKLEELINTRPEFWLWSHRRWKHTRKREDEEGRGIYRFSENNTRR